jgi:hypothetical protein
MRRDKAKESKKSAGEKIVGGVKIAEEGKWRGNSF